ncbi:MAG: AAA family ATPase [Planctomycetes bacterium]|nr:AAA family ATPase [Planctomycetota bacterium]
MSTDLNAPQRLAVRTLRGPLLVLAGAGTGKTRVVTYRIAELIRHGVAPDRILGVTFTNKAAGEMAERITGLLGARGKGKARPRIATFHAHALDVLRRHIVRIGYPARFAIYDRGDQESVARSVLREIRVPTETLRPSDLLFHIGFWKSRSISPKDALATASTDRELTAATGFRRYQKALKLAGAVDFDDLLLCVNELFDKFPDVRDAESTRFDHLLVDEYQDTNGAQYRIVRTLASPHRNLCVVGDDDQSIYGFRGAEVEHILRFQKDWPDAVVVRLEDNYRCTAEILNVANRLIAFNRHRHDKVLRPSRPGGAKPLIEQYPDEEAEAREIVARIEKRMRLPGRSPRDFAVLFRTNEQPRPFETELRRRNVPYVLVGGMSFFDRGEVRDALAYLRLLESPDDEVSLLRVINTPARGIGKKTVESLVAKAVAAGVPAWSIIEDSRGTGDLPPAARNAVNAFAADVRTFRGRFLSGEVSSLHDFAREWLVHVRYRSHLDQQFDDVNERDARWANVEQVINALAAFERNAPKAELGDFLRELTIQSRDQDDDKEKELRRDAVVLMTLHSAKGLEFPEVYLVGMEEGVLPHHRSLGDDASAVDEERRLCYVGITRAQESLTFSMALSRRKWGKPRETQPSRFLFELAGLADRPGPSGAKKAPRRGR